MKNELRWILTQVTGDMHQKVPQEYIQAYGDAIKSYAHIYGSIYFKNPGTSIDDMIQAAVQSEGPHKEEILEALKYTQEQIKNNQEKFKKWCLRELT